MGDISAEPSMEDILSSIKRIIAEEGDAPRPRRMSPPRAAATARARAEAPVDDGDGVLELSDPLGETASEAGSRSTQPAYLDQDARQDHPGRRAPDAASVPSPEREAPVAAAAPATSAATAKVSAATVEAARGALDSLSRLVVKPDQPGSDTLEGLVSEMLRPMLAQWLDAHLPALVEQMVAREIARITASEL